MKLEALHLKAFGAFEDYRVDFSGGNPGFHLLYGPNEAGKSTTLRAITQLLYGIPTRTPDDFRHSMKNLRIGATVSHDDTQLTFYRRKGKSKTLLAEDDKTALSDTVLFPFLGGVDEATFTHLFGLSHEQLVQGGEALVQGEGDVGQALFSAAAGMGNLRKVLDALEDEAGTIFKPSGSIPRINGALKQLREVRSALKLAQVLPKEWAAIAEALAELREERNQLLEVIKALVSEQSRLERVLKALPLIAQRQELLTRLADVEDAIALPEDFRERRLAAVQDHATASEVYQVAAAALTRLHTQRNELDVDESLLAQEARIETLHGRHLICLKAQEDKRENLDPELRHLLAEVKRLHRALKLDDGIDLEVLRPEPGVTQRINELAQQGKAIEKDKAHALAQQKKYTREREGSAAELDRLGDLPDASALRKAVQEARAVLANDGDIAERVRSLDLLKRRLEDDVMRLDGWNGTADELLSLTIPAASSIERVRIQLENEDAERRRWVEERRALEKECGDLESQRKAFQRAQNVPTEALLKTHRTAREKAWHFARKAWDGGKPSDVSEGDGIEGFLQDLVREDVAATNLVNAVEQLTHRADETADRLRRESDRAAAVAQLESSYESARKRLTDLEKTIDEADRQRPSTQLEWEAMWAPAGMTPKTPAEMAEWRTAYAGIVEGIRRARDEEMMLAGHSKKVAQQTAILKSTLATIGEETEMTDLDLMLEDAEDLLEAHRVRTQQHAHWKAQWSQAESALAQASEVVQQNDEAEAQWKETWAEMMQRVGGRPDASTTEADAKLSLLTALFATLDQVSALELRITQIDDEYNAYLDAVGELAAVAGTLADEQPLELLVPTLYQHLKSQRQMATEKSGLVKQCEQESARVEEAEAALARADSELEDLRSLAQVDEVGELEAADLRSQRLRQFSVEQRALDARLLDVSPGLSLDAFLAMVSDEDPDAVTARLQAIGPELERAEQEAQKISEDIGKKESELNAMDGSDAAAILAEEAETLQAAIAEDARQYAQYKVAHYVLNEAIERYRDANQEPLLARASVLFETLTLGSFQELRADQDSRGNQVLCGFRADSTLSVHVAGMSEGTADQLYLALRLASLERHLERHAPIPFVLDDILVNFDDERAAATLKVLSELAKQTQVIYFTHHKHLVELAKKHVTKGQLFTHSLTG